MPYHDITNFQYTRGSLLLKQTHATDLPLELAPSYQTSLIRGSKTREQKFFFLRNILFRQKSLVQTRERCSGSVLQERATEASSLVCTGLQYFMFKQMVVNIIFNSVLLYFYNIEKLEVNAQLSKTNISGSTRISVKM